MSRTFPIMLPRGYANPHGYMVALPWGVLAQRWERAWLNHRQDLERLAERGGLSPMEAHLIMTDQHLTAFRTIGLTEDQAHALVDKAARAYLKERTKHEQDTETD